MSVFSLIRLLSLLFDHLHFFFFLLEETPMYPGSSLTSLEQPLQEAVSWATVLSKSAKQNINFQLLGCAFLFSWQRDEQRLSLGRRTDHLRGPAVSAVRGLGVGSLRTWSLCVRHVNEGTHPHVHVGGCPCLWASSWAKNRKGKCKQLLM